MEKINTGTPFKTLFRKTLSVLNKHFFNYRKASIKRAPRIILLEISGYIGQKQRITLQRVQQQKKIKISARVLHRCITVS